MRLGNSPQNHNVQDESLGKLKVPQKFQKLRSNFRMLILVTLGSVGVSAGLISQAHDNKNQHSLVSPRPKKQFPENIAIVLPDLIKDSGKIIDFPENFNPNLPNFFIVMEEHFEHNTEPALRARRYNIQNEALEIGVTLNRLGVDKQYLEGINLGNELNPTSDAGAAVKIKRANIQLELMLGNEILSMGIDDRALITSIQNGIKEAYNIYYISAEKEIFRELRSYLGEDNAQNITKNLTNDQLNYVISNIVMTNHNYITWLEETSVLRFKLITERNKIWANFINSDLQSTHKHSMLICGGGHAAGLKSMIKGANVFIIAPNSYQLNEKSLSIGTPENYKSDLTELDLYFLGITQSKPTSSFIVE